MAEMVDTPPEPPVFLLTVDVEDWFQVENFKPWIPFESWEKRKSRVVANTLKLLDCIDGLGCEKPIRATFFVLGWVAERYPFLVKEINDRGHEVASHGYNHRMVSTCTDAELFDDLSSSRKCLEDILGAEVKGFRAPSFSVEPRLIGILKRCGYRYDSSLNSFSGNERYGTLGNTPNATQGVITLSEGIYEFPVTNLSFRHRAVPWGGGGFFRLIPKRIYTCGVQAKAKQSGAFLFYMHPWEVDPEQPRVERASLVYKFRHYVNLDKTLDKLRFLCEHLKGASFLSCSEHLNNVTQYLDTPQGGLSGRQANT